MRFSARTVAVSIAASAVVASASVTGSVNASALEPSSASASMPAVASGPTEAQLFIELGTAEQVYRQRALRTLQLAKAKAKARAQARAVRIAKVRARIVQVAKKQLGDRYSAGSAGPSAFDCSGFTLYVYRVAAGKHLPHYSGAQYRVVKKIALKTAKPGDLVFFLRNGAHHVGIYLGKGHMIDAAGYGKGVRISPISGSWWGRSYSGVGRLLPA